MACSLIKIFGVKSPYYIQIKNKLLRERRFKSTHKDRCFKILPLRAELFIRCWLDSLVFGSFWLFSLVLEYKCNHWSSTMRAEHQPTPWYILYLGSTVLLSKMRGQQHVLHTAACNRLEQQLPLLLDLKWQKSDAIWI